MIHPCIVWITFMEKDLAVIRSKRIVAYTITAEERAVRQLQQDERTNSEEISKMKRLMEETSHADEKSDDLRRKFEQERL
jgi:hypothetical protein